MCLLSQALRLCTGSSNNVASGPRRLAGERMPARIEDLVLLLPLKVDGGVRGCFRAGLVTGTALRVMSCPPRAVADPARRPVAVGRVPGVGQVDERLGGEQRPDVAEDGETAHAGVEDADGAVHSGGRGHAESRCGRRNDRAAETRTNQFMARVQRARPLPGNQRQRVLRAVITDGARFGLGEYLLHAGCDVVATEALARADLLPAQLARRGLAVWLAADQLVAGLLGVAAIRAPTRAAAVLARMRLVSAWRAQLRRLVPVVPVDPARQLPLL
jgi:hypothetical protein